jgi:hypothetical protein
MQYPLTGGKLGSGAADRGQCQFLFFKKVNQLSGNQIIGRQNSMQLLMGYHSSGFVHCFIRRPFWQDIYSHHVDITAIFYP